MKAFAIRCARPILVAEFCEPQAMLSWSLTRPGFTTSRTVAWLQVSDNELPVGVDPVLLLKDRMRAAGLEDSVHLMTSRDIDCHHLATASIGDTNAACLATVGLGNAGRIGANPAPFGTAGTINLLAHVDRPLSQGAFVEAISIAAEARTASIIDLDWKPNGEIITGTGTDCIVVAAPVGTDTEQFSGLHTDIGAALGRAVYDAVSLGGHAWITEQTAIECGS